MRVLHLPTVIGGNAWALSRAERYNGVKSDVLVTGTSIFSDKYDILLSRPKSKVLYALKIARFYMEATKKYDVFHFNFGTSLVTSRLALLNMIDLEYLRHKKKAIFVTYQGSDARLPSYCWRNYEYTYFDEDDVKASVQNEIYKERNKRKFDKYANFIYTTNPDLLNVLPRRTKFRPYTKLDLDDWRFDSYSDYGKEELIIGHAPSNRKVKGTAYVVKAVEELQKEGFPIRLLLIEGIPNSEVRSFYRQADLFVDQLLVGWYGGLSVEVMSLGKPVIVYLRHEDLVGIPNEMREDLPFINANPRTIFQTLKHCYVERASLSERAMLSRRFVEKWHNSNEIARSVIEDYKRALEQV
ncbi:hypothetical protein [Mesotoga sp. UBA5557]|jgi:hypothetical protein|uniref:hypothetical protein n=1 Tax=Mesotoga sp. UBA5557 TaxID=1946857 RepID=UPI0025D5391E|nr:hypothetical protein [Mesotoga sp. UBA5557]